LCKNTIQTSRKNIAGICAANEKGRVCEDPPFFVDPLADPVWVTLFFSILSYTYLIRVSESMKIIRKRDGKGE
jgi:hypothetical protein